MMALFVFPRSDAPLWVVAAVLCSALVVGVGASPSAAASDAGGAADGAATPVVGGFGLGDRIEGLIDEQTGVLSVDLPVAGVGMGWSSQLSAVDRFGLGPGWGLSGVGFVDTVGGVRVFPASGGVFIADASVPSGLRDYVLDNLTFTRVSGMVPARADGVVGDRQFAFRLVELGGVVSYFGADGNPVARVDRFGNRTDWVWKTGNRLSKVINPIGVVTELGWSVPGKVTVTTGAATGGTVVTGTVEVREGRVSEVVDPSGGRTIVTYDSAGLISAVRGVSGAITETTWQTLADGSTGVDRVRVKDATTGVVFSERTWDAVAGFASGHPTYRGAGELFASGDDLYRYSTALTDGPTTVISEYNATGLLIGREVTVTTPAGVEVIQEQGFTYPGTETGGVPDPAALPDQYNRPTTTTSTHRNPGGGTRTVAEDYVFDAYGRVTLQTAADGTSTETSYDPVIPADMGVPVGLPVTQTVTAPDGLMTKTVYELNEDHTAAVASETFTGHVELTDEAGQVVLTRTGRVEQDVAADGFVTQQRVFAQGGTGIPTITNWDRVIDLQGGTVTTSETVAAGTDLAATVREVADVVTAAVLASTDVLGNTTTSAYDGAGRPVAHTSPDGLVATMAYRTVQQDGVNATVTTTPDGVVTTEQRDVLGRVVRIIDNLTLDDPQAGAVPANGQERVIETRSYPTPGTVTVTDAWGAVTTTRQDALGREIETVAPNGLTKITRYDDVASTTTTGLTPTGELADAETTSTQTTNVQGKVTATHGAREDGVPILPTETFYDGYGRPTNITDGTLTTQVEFDAFSNPVTTTITPNPDLVDGMNVVDLGAGVGNPITATRRFDARGVSVEKTLSTGAESRSGGTQEMDLLGRTVSETDQDGNTTAYKYTPDGLPTTITTSYGQVTTNTYHPVTRQLLETRTLSPIGDPLHTVFQHDPITGAVLAAWDPADPDGTRLTHTYDGHGNTLTTTYPDGNTIRHEYDQHGRKLSTTDIAGNTTVFAYDATGLLTGVVQTSRDGEPVASVGYVYDDHGRITTLTRGNGVTTTYTFTSVNQIATETTTGPDGQSQSARTYTYDPAGNLTTRVDDLRNPDTGTAEATTTGYKYDAHHRLVSSTLHSGNSTEAPVASRTTYTVTVSGDIATETTTTHPATADETTTTRKFEYTPTGKLTGITTTHPDGTVTVAEQVYDMAGNLTHAADGTQYTYNAANQPATETTPTGEIISSGYWVTGQRATLTHGHNTTQFYWDGVNLINDTHVTGTTPPDTASYLIGTTRHTRTTFDDTSYYVHDRHGNVTELTARSGETRTRYAYTDYGITAIGAATPVYAEAEREESAVRVGDASYQPFRYASEYTTPTHAATQWLQVRAYDPATMRFTTMDTASLHNLYAYADLNPITKTDPTGRSSLIDTIVNGVLVGLEVAFAVFTIWSAAATGGASLGLFGIVRLISITGLVADTAGVAISSVLLVNDHRSEFLKPNVREGLTYATYGLGGLGLAGAVGSAFLRGGVRADTADIVEAATSRQSVDAPVSRQSVEDVEQLFGSMIRSDLDPSAQRQLLKPLTYIPPTQLQHFAEYVRKNDGLIELESPVKDRGSQYSDGAYSLTLQDDTVFNTRTELRVPAQYSAVHEIGHYWAYTLRHRMKQGGHKLRLPKLNDFQSYMETYAFKLMDANPSRRAEFMADGGYLSSGDELFADLYAWRYGPNPTKLYGSETAAQELRSWMDDLLKDY